MEELTKENNNENFICFHYFWAMFSDQKVFASYTELYQLIPERKTSVVELELNQILTLKFRFSNLFSIIIYMFAQGYLS